MGREEKSKYVEIEGLDVENEIVEFMEKEEEKGKGVEKEKLWKGFEEIIRDIEKKKREMIEKSEEIKERIEEW